MATNNPVSVDSTEFERVAAGCRWLPRSLSAARAVIVDRVTVPEAAQSHGMSAKQVRMQVRRFIEKVERQREIDAESRVAAFMQREPPLLDTSELEPHAEALRKLWSKGYQVAQLVDFLAANGVITNPVTVSRFIRSFEA